MDMFQGGGGAHDLLGGSPLSSAPTGVKGRQSSRRSFAQKISRRRGALTGQDLKRQLTARSSKRKSVVAEDRRNIAENRRDRIAERAAERGVAAVGSAFSAIGTGLATSAVDSGDFPDQNVDMPYIVFLVQQRLTPELKDFVIQSCGLEQIEDRIAFLHGNASRRPDLDRVGIRDALMTYILPDLCPGGGAGAGASSGTASGGSFDLGAGGDFGDRAADPSTNAADDCVNAIQALSIKMWYPKAQFLLVQVGDPRAQFLLVQVGGAQFLLVQVGEALLAAG